MRPKDLIKILEDLPEEKEIICQLVGQDDVGAWNMFFDFQDVPDMNMIQLRVDHPELKAVPQQWSSGHIDTPHDGNYLCAIEQDQECGVTWQYQRVVSNIQNSWKLESGERVIKWKALEPFPKDEP